MKLIEHLCTITLRQVVGDGAEHAVRTLFDHFNERGQALNRALIRSNNRAWRALEVALAGEGLFGWLKSADDRALAAQMRPFVDQIPMPAEVNGRPRLRALILSELRDARTKQLLTSKLEPEALASQAGTFARFSNPQDVLAAEKRVLHEMARYLKEAGYDNLAWLLHQPAHAGDSVLVAAARYFFRLEVERDPRLAHTLQLTALDGLAASQQGAFACLETALGASETRLEQALMAMQTQLLGAVESVGDQVRQVGQQVEEVKALQAVVVELIQRLDMRNQPLRPSHSLSIHNERELALVRDALRRFRGLPPTEQSSHPGLMNDLGKLQVAAGDFGGARETFARVASLAPSDAARAEASYNTYRAALEQGEHEEALRALSKAVAIDPERYAPFPLDKYEPVRILGAGGFGVTFLCRHRFSKGQVAVKALFAEELDRDVGKVLEEATTLDSLKHHSIVALRDCGFVDAQQRRSYLVMEYFPGQTLQEYVGKVGTLNAETALTLAVRMAEALHAAHGMGVLHRDVKPANVLLHADGKSLDLRLIDFGLAVKRDRVDGATTQRPGHTIQRTSIAGTVDYAAPEQMGKLPGARVGPTSDVYSFGKTLAFALFGVPEPGLQHYRRLPSNFAELLSKCMSHSPKERPADFAEVLDELRACQVPPVAKPLLVVSAQLAGPAVDELPDLELETREPPRNRPNLEKAREKENEAGDVTFTTRLIHAVLAWVFGLFGVQKFAQGNVSAGVVRVLVSLTCIGLYVTLFVGMIEAIMYLVKSDRDYYRTYYVEKRNWF